MSRMDLTEVPIFPSTGAMRDNIDEMINTWKEMDKKALQARDELAERKQQEKETTYL